MGVLSRAAFLSGKAFVLRGFLSGKALVQRDFFLAGLFVNEASVCGAFS